MRAHRVAAPLVVFGLAAGCGGSSPSAPSTVTPPTAVNAAATQAIVGAALTQATGMLVGAVPGGLSSVMTRACPGGGSMTISLTVTTPTAPSGTLTTSSLMEFSDCRSQTVAISGDRLS